MTTNQSPNETICITELPNGIRIVSEFVGTVDSVSLGLWIGTGSCDESPEEAGITHFIEHMLFKGTDTRTAHKIADDIEAGGGQLNAFTSKDVTCYDARVLTGEIETAMDVLCDMLCNSIFDEEEIAREKLVVLEEIKMIDDTPEEAVMDLYDLTAFGSNPLAPPVLGSAKTVTNFTRDMITNTISSRYRPNRIVIAAAGNLRHDKLVDLATRYLGHLNGAAKPRPSVPLTTASAEKRVTKRDAEQVHFVIGGPGFSRFDSRRYSLSILNNCLGGNMSSRLFQEIREKRGLAYSIGTYSRSYETGGSFCAYGGTSSENFDKVVELTRTEFDRVRQDGLTGDELRKSLRQMHGMIALGLEAMPSRMARLGESMMSHNRVIPLHEVFELYQAVNHETVLDAARLALEPNDIAMAAIGPFKPTRKRRAN